MTLSLIFSGMTAMGSSKGVASVMDDAVREEALARLGRLADGALADGDHGGAAPPAPREISSSSCAVFSPTMKTWKASAPIRLITISWTMRTTSL